MQAYYFKHQELYEFVHFNFLLYEIFERNAMIQESSH